MGSLFSRMIRNDGLLTKQESWAAPFVATGLIVGGAITAIALGLWKYFLKPLIYWLTHCY